ncbi:MAG: rubrerythrin [Candidatus Sericytochromatia bacterium]|nr:rubrerythrin [Candidatus Sericytochromatia bacterium]
MFTPIDKTVTRKNLEAAFGGESMAYQKYLFFARVARELGNEQVATLFEETARQETAHAYGHLDLLYPRATLTIEKLLELAIEGETYEYTTMYPEFRQKAEDEQDDKAVAEFLHQEAESKEHADIFREALKKAEKRFAALTRVEARHAKQYSDTLAAL